MKKELRDYFAQMGRKGGKATGPRKRRSDDFYANLARKGVEGKKRKRELKSMCKGGEPNIP